jgi:exodeoxyribonuclease-5
MALTLTPDQERAASEILEAQGAGDRYLLTGYAGSGKTTLMQELTRRWKARGLKVALTAPTHKAVAVLSRKLRQAGIEDVDCRTIFSLLSLQPKIVADRQVFERQKTAKPVLADVVVIDECSMIGADLMGYIRRYLPVSFVLFVGDPAQLPPVGEAASESFDTKARSHLDTIVRQSAENPILSAAHAIRVSQGGPMDWSWCKPAKAPPLGVYLPGADANAWMKKAFTSADFDADPDSFRCLAWTNNRVAEINQMIRTWRYGSQARVPFVPGEFALIRAPIIQDKVTIFSTNEEAEVIGIARDTLHHDVEGTGRCDGWTIDLPSWRVTLAHRSGQQIDVQMSADINVFARAERRFRDEAAQSRERWRHLFEFKEAVAQLHPIYAMTVHTSQGSTFGNAFVDVADIRRRAASNPLETQQLLYVAATRPERALVLVGA